ncbi:hypothetical protein B0H14DRAFT_2578767 [Mycena olivaceomarginata]|nr:hypothetical protein B0H14DRAFT_2578767 [Mycena olivaceomarginata]
MKCELSPPEARVPWSAWGNARHLLPTENVTVLGHWRRQQQSRRTSNGGNDLNAGKRAGDGGRKGSRGKIGGPPNWNIDSSDRRSVRASKEHRNEGKKSSKCKETGEGMGTITRGCSGVNDSGKDSGDCTAQIWDRMAVRNMGDDRCSSEWDVDESGVLPNRILT